MLWVVLRCLLTVVVVDAESGILLSLLTKKLAKGELAPHRDCGCLYLLKCLVHAIPSLVLFCLSAQSCLLCSFHDLVGCFDAAVGSGSGWWVCKYPDTVHLVALKDHIRIREFHVFLARKLQIEVIQSSSIKDSHTVAVGADRRWCELAEEESALNTKLLPLLSFEVECIKSSVRCYMFYGRQLWIFAAEDREIEFFI